MLDQFENSMRYTAHKGFAGMQIFCPVCLGVLDCRSATSFDVLNKVGAIVFSKVICNKCLAPRRAGMIAAAIKSGGTVELFDGRTKKLERVMPMIDKIIDYENGELVDDDAIELFQELIDTGLAWQLQGHYGRTAAALIEAGRCKEKRIFCQSTAQAKSPAPKRRKRLLGF